MVNNFRKIKDKDKIILYPDSSYAASYEHLPPSLYKLGNAGSLFSGIIPSFEPVPEGDRLVRFTSGVITKVMNSTESFFSDETKRVYAELKISHKMGIMFYGKPGTGKTSVCMLIMKMLTERYGALCFDGTGKSLDFLLYCLKKVREVQDAPIVLFIDEFETSVRNDEEGYLTFLDGTSSIGNLIFICCTNYAAKIPDRIKKRKSRIKHLYNIDSLPEGVYREYLLDRVPTMAEAKVKEFAFKAAEKGLTIDQFKHALVDHVLERVSIDKAIEGSAKFEVDEE